MHSAEEALVLGLVSEVVPEAKFEARFLETCDALAEVAPIAARQTKRVLHRASLATNLAAFASDELANARRGLASEDSREARRALMAKRKPEFEGR
jgi:enoyl-CoA hydratase/carnithine racemase